MKTALIPGSFDPITLGHIDIIRRTAKIFDKVYVAVMTNDMTKYEPDAKVKKYMFTMDERKRMARLACEGISNVEVVSYGGMLIDLVDGLGVDTIIKGVRNSDDFEYEQKHAIWNREHNPKAETLYMPADERFDGVSSTLARGLIEEMKPLDCILPTPVIKYIETKRTK